VIRLAIKKDVKGIRDCADQAYAHYVARMGQKPAPMLANFEEQIASEVVYVATGNDSKLEGFIVFFPEGQHIMLENVAVLPSAAGRGVGKALIQFCEDEGKRSGFDLVQIYTNEKMTENLSIYPRLGYTEVERRTENGFKRVYFEKRLS
jgi:ribosomal protein S18 acetylase RimI-like enzyme